MAIIYSYPVSLNILDTDTLIGTTTQIVSGRPKNQTKSFKIEELVDYFRPNLDQVLQVGNVSELDAKIGQLYLYDNPDGGYAKISVDDRVFRVDRSVGGSMLTIDNGGSLVLNNGVASAQIINTLTTSRSYTLPNKSGTFALTSDTTLQAVVDSNNIVTLAPDDTEAININMSATPTVSQKGIRVTVPIQTAASAFPNSDAYIALINGQNPGSLANYVGGFYAVAQSGSENISFISEHSAGVVDSIHFSGTNVGPAISDFTSFFTGGVEVFKINSEGNTTAKSFIKSGGTSAQYLMADGSVTTGSAGTQTLQQTVELGNIITGYFIGIEDGGNASYLTASRLSTENATNGTFLSAGKIGFGTLSNLIELGLPDSLTANRIIKLPNASGTVALTTIANSAGTFETKLNGNSVIVRDSDTLLGTEIYNDAIRFRKDNGSGSIRYINLLSPPNITDFRDITFPDASGTIALTSDITAPNLQQVTTQGSVITNTITINDVSQETALDINLTDDANGVGVSTNTNFITGYPYFVVDQFANIIFSVAHNGDVTGNKIVKTGGTSDQILLADGSTSFLSAKANLASPTFTGTVVLPSTTSIGNVSASELGYLDNVTSPIQTQLDSTVKVLLNEFPNTSTTGYSGGTQVLLSSFLIPANTFPASSMPNFKLKFSKTNDAGGTTIRLYLNTSNTLTGATILGLNSATSTVDTFIFVRNPLINSGVIRAPAPTASFSSDESTASSTESAITFNTALPYYLLVSAENTTVTDTTTVTTLRSFKIIN